MKMDYSFQLGKQIHELRKKREILKKEKESESLLIEKNCIDFEGYKEAMKTKKLEKIKKLRKLRKIRKICIKFLIF